MSSAEAQDVTAMNSVISKATAPDLPSRALAANADARPEETCSGVMA